MGRRKKKRREEANKGRRKKKIKGEKEIGKENIRMLGNVATHSVYNLSTNTLLILCAVKIRKEKTLW